jgi:hypothetical protein
MRKLQMSTCAVVAAAAMFAMTGAASAATLTLTGPIQGNTVGPQSTSAPCVIAGTQCSQPANFGFNNFVQGGAQTAFNAYSTTPTASPPDGLTAANLPYSVSQISAVVGTSFVVAIDVNTAGGAGGHMETLQFFEVIDTTTNTVLYTFGALNSAGTLIGNIANQGNGFGDWQLSTVSLAGLSPTDGILFHAQWKNDTDGAESFFLVSSTTSAVPEPATWGMMLLGFVGLGFAFRQSRRKVSFA